MKINSRIKHQIVSALVLITVGFASFTASADTYVNGYFKSNGTYVQGHYRSSPDSSYNNNWSVSPNINPYTGLRGTRQPTWNDKSPYSSGNNFYLKSLW